MTICLTSRQGNSGLTSQPRSGHMSPTAHAGRVGSGSVIAAGHPFYDSTAFWPAAGIVVGLLAIAATVWVTLRAANPKRRLYYDLLADTPLITRRQDLSDELKITYGEQELKSPRVVNVQLVSRGRRDIARDAFDGGEPLCLDLGTPIVECVKVTTSPSDRRDPKYATDGSKLLITPSHFGRRQTTIFSLLVDGEPPEIVEPQQSMIDVEIRQGDASRPLGRRDLVAIALLGTPLFVVTLVGHAPWSDLARGLLTVLVLLTTFVLTILNLDLPSRSGE
jgi:hypothetical protein